MSEQQSGQQHVIVVGPDGQPVAVPADAVQQSEDADDGQGDDLSELTDLVEQPAKVMRIGSMIRQLLEEVKSAPLDDASRNRLKEIHRSSIKELESGLAPELVEELERLSLPFTEDATPSDAELRIAQAQLVGWLEGLFHGIQTAIYAQQVSARAQFEQMRRALPSGGPGRGQGLRPGMPPQAAERRPGQRPGRRDVPLSASDLAGRTPAQAADDEQAQQADDQQRRARARAAARGGGGSASATIVNSAVAGGGGSRLGARRRAASRPGAVSCVVARAVPGVAISREPVLGDEEDVARALGAASAARSRVPTPGGHHDRRLDQRAPGRPGRRSPGSVRVRCLPVPCTGRTLLTSPRKTTSASLMSWSSVVVGAGRRAPAAAEPRGPSPSRTPSSATAVAAAARRVVRSRSHGTGHVTARRASARTVATPSSSLAGATWSAASSTEGCALATAYDVPAQASIARSLGMSPKATTSCGSTLAARTAAPGPRPW